jgi:hypothetical protein
MLIIRKSADSTTRAELAALMHLLLIGHDPEAPRFLAGGLRESAGARIGNASFPCESSPCRKLALKSPVFDAPGA